MEKYLYRCGYCGATSTKYGEIMNHLRIVHGEPTEPYTKEQLAERLEELHEMYEII